jgi:hypothetical protein
MPGHPPDISEDQAEAMRRRRAEGATLEQIASENGVHHSTADKHTADVELGLVDEYEAMLEQLRAAARENFAESLQAVKAGDYERIDACMKARAVLTQQTKALLIGRGLWVTTTQGRSAERDTATETFLAERRFMRDVT